MSRPPRLLVRDGIYHVSARGNERSEIYRDADDRRRFLALLAELRERYRWRCLCYCLMTNHYHLLVKTPEKNLAEGMRQLNSVYAQWFNRRHSRNGHLFQGRYNARLVQADEHLLAVASYIVRNPVRAGLCRRPEQWPWSSYRDTAADNPTAGFDATVLLAHFGPSLALARQRYREHCARDLATERQAHPLVCGDDAFLAEAVDRVEPAPGIPRRYLMPPRPDLAVVLASPGNDALASARDHGYPLREIAGHLGVHASTISRRLRRHRGTQRPETTKAHVAQQAAAGNSADTIQYCERVDLAGASSPDRAGTQ